MVSAGQSSSLREALAAETGSPFSLMPQQASREPSIAGGRVLR